MTHEELREVLAKAYFTETTKLLAPENKDNLWIAFKSLYEELIDTVFLAQVAEAVKQIEIPNNTGKSVYENGKYVGAVEFRDLVKKLLTGSKQG